MYLAFCSGGLAGNRLHLRTKTVRIGRSAKSQVRLTASDTTSSGTHARLERADGDWVLHDERSTTGTFVNGVRIQPTTPTKVYEDDWIMFGASGPTALLQGRADRPPHAWLVVEPEAHPGRFLAVSDQDSVRLALGGDGLLLPVEQARDHRSALTVHLDRYPIVAEPAGGDATVRQDHIATGHLLPLGEEQAFVRILGARGAPPAGTSKVGIGQHTLMRAVHQSGRRNRKVMFTLVGVTFAALLIAGFCVVQGIQSDREQDRAEVADVSGDLSDAERRHSADRTKTDAERTQLLAQLDAMKKRFDAGFTKERKHFAKLVQTQQAKMDKALAKASKSERETFATILETYKRSVFLMYTVTTFTGVKNGDGSPVRTSSFGTGWAASADGLLVTNKHVAQGWKFDTSAQALLARFPTARPVTVIYAWPAGTSFMGPNGRPPNPKTGFNTVGRRNLKLLGVAADDWGPLRPATFAGKDVQIRTHKVVSDGDLAVLRLSGTKFAPLPIKADPSKLKNLDPVMLLGFPLGAQVIDSGKSDLSASLGTIRFVTGDVKHTASSFGGNSGGPLLSLDGHVVGVHSRAPITGGGSSAETFGMAIRSDVVIRFLRTYR